MGILSDIAQWLAATVRKLVEAILNAINNLSNEAKIARLKMRDELARLMQFDVFFIAYAIWSVGAVVMTAGFSAAVSAWWATSALKGRVEDWVESLSLSNFALRFEQFRLISQIAQLIFPEYRAIVSDIYKALGGISKIIYDATDSMSTWMISSRRVVYSALVVAGFDPESSEVMSYMATEPWVIKVRNRYRRYVENPYLIMSDLEDEVIKPVLTNLTEENRERLEKINDAYLRTQANVEAIRDLNDAVKEWVAIHPEDIAAQIDDKIGGVLDYVDGVFDKVVDPIMETIGDSLDLINQAVEKSDRRMAELARSFPDLKTLIYDFFFLDPTDRDDALKMLRFLINKDIAYSQQGIRDEIDQRFYDYLNTISIEVERPPALEVEPAELPSVSVSVPTVQYPKGSWFVGEY